MKKIQLKGLFKVVFLLALCLGASLVANALGMNDNNHNVQMAAVTPVALPLLNQTAEKEMIKNKITNEISPNSLFVTYIKSIIATESSFIVTKRFSFSLTISSNVSICFSAALKISFLS